MTVPQWFAGNETLVQSALILALLGYSIQLAARSGAMSLAGVGFFGIGGFAAGRFAQEGWNTALVMVVVAAGGAVAALLLSLVFARLRGLYFAMGTLAFTLFVQSLAESWESLTGGVNGLFGIPLTMTTAGLLLMVVLIAAYSLATQHGRPGRRLHLLAGDEGLAASLGVPVGSQRQVAVVLSGVAGGLAGAAQATTFGVFSPGEVSFGLVVSAVTVLVIGGSASWLGPVLGAFAVTWLPVWLEFTGEWRAVVQSVLVVVLVVFLPAGLTGLAQGLALRRGRLPRRLGRSALESTR